MRALVFDGDNLEVHQHYPPPEPGPDEAMVRVTLAGICTTDLEILRGYAGFRGVPGYPLEQGQAAFAHAAGPGVLKVLLQPV